ncbi:MAG: glycogen debranching protein GlgX [Deltaproteobacteria bacterium]|nr:glycogen debranching protein GlgX [Deltaproteobacteria bacterium]
MRVLPGAPAPLGARFRHDEQGAGVDFAVASSQATRIEVCLFDTPGAAVESARVALPERSGDVWHGRLLGLRPGQLYGLRAHGPWRPEAGQRCNPAKLLVDPYARALSGPVVWDEALRGTRPGSPAEPDPRDTARWMPKGVLLDDGFDWEGDAPPGTPWSRTVLYECHVKGMTQCHPGVPAEQRGRFLGLAAGPVVEHLLALGATAVELLPVQHHAIDAHLAALGLPNYWGYMTLGFFAPDPRFASGALGQQVSEFRTMVKRLHRAGLEVILDVVYNHTPEGGADGPTLSLRGLDDAGYYRHRPDAPGEYLDFTGCGNSLDTGRPRALQLVLDSLRYWVEEMHVDGFRFDLATVLARDGHQFEPFGRFFEFVRQDPVLAGVKLIAEPWDLGPGGWQLGRFPVGWSEWNDRFRDATRRFWRGDGGQLPELASRIAGSSDFFGAGGRPPQASVNFVAAHDGLTLRDLVSYARKHNEANGEGNRDGGHDESANWGVEGESASLRVRKLRARVRRNLFATLALAQGVPMISHGDELGRTQGGNNNAYCIDDERTWIDWEGADAEMLAFARAALALRRDNAVFRRRRFFRGEAAVPGLPGDVAWLRPEGGPMQEADWHDASRRALGLLIPAASADPADERGRPQAARTVLLLLNGGPRTQGFLLPDPGGEGVWCELLDSACAQGSRSFRAGERLPVAAHGLLLLAAGAGG